MRKEQKKIIFWSAFCLLCLGFIGTIFIGFQKPVQEYSEKVTQTEDVKTEKSILSNEVKKEVLVEKNTISKSIKVEEEGTTSSKALLKIENTELEISISEKTSVYDVMKTLAAEGKISFKGKEYLGLGFFVTQVGSLVSGEGKNLMYYINDKEASVGVSSYIIKEGDIIEWKLK